ncbi:MAG TPA: PIN domain-containing protein [Gemmataceae bacterium]|nr:PIN domain-containing protein [Gemmataceae bacterium]
MILIDTSYFVALLDPRDGLHAHAKAWAAHITEPLVVTEHVLWETINFASHPVNRPKVHALVAHVRAEKSYELIPASPDLFEAGLDLHARRPDTEWSLTDCISFVVMARRGITRALTYDHHFEQAGFEALLRRAPGL